MPKLKKEKREIKFWLTDRIKKKVGEPRCPKCGTKLVKVSKKDDTWQLKLWRDEVLYACKNNCKIKMKKNYLKEKKKFFQVDWK